MRHSETGPAGSSPDEKSARWLDEFGDLVMVEDPDGNVVHLDRGSSDLLPEDVVCSGPSRAVFGTLADTLFVPVDFLDAVDDLRRLGRPEHGQRFLGRDGSWLELDYHRADASTELRHLWRARTVSLNAVLSSSRHRITDLVRASEEWRQTFDAIPALVIRLDTSGSIVHINAAAQIVAGRSYRELAGTPIGDLSDQEPWRIISQMTHEVMAFGESRQSAVRSPTDDRTWDVTALRAEDRIIVTARDITTETQLHASLRQSEQMSAMGSLVAGVAHEVRNPLFSISATLDAFEARFGNRGEYQRHLAALRAEVARLSNLMQGLLEYGRPAAQSVEPEAIDTLISEAIDECAALATARGIRIETYVDEQAPAILVDARQITQVIRNLLDNAILHSPDGSSVDVAAIPTAKNPIAGGVTITVCDRGPGISQLDRERIFEPFFTRRRGGTGLGLAIVQRAVLGHGGDVTVKPRPGGGTCVVVQLPRGEREA